MSKEEVALELTKIYFKSWASVGLKELEEVYFGFLNKIKE